MAYDLQAAFKAGLTSGQIADYLAEQQGYDIKGAREAGLSDDRILNHLINKGDTATAFGTQLMMGMTSSLAGIAQLTGLVDDATLRAQQREADVLSAGSPVMGTVGRVVGDIVDPVAIPAAALAPIRGATMASQLAKQGLAQGVFSGYVEPVLKEDANAGALSMERVTNAGLGGIVGLVFGGGLGKGIDFLTNRAAKINEPTLTTKETTDNALSSLVERDKELLTKKEVDVREQLVQQLAPAEIKISGKDITNRPLSVDEEKIISDRIAILKSQVDDLRWKQAEGEAPTKDEATQQVAALFRGKEKAPEQMADNLPPQPGAGLVAPTKQTPQTELAALLRKPETAPTQPIQVEKDTPKLAALLRSQGIDNDIKIKREQIRMLEQQLLESNRRKAAMAQPELVQVETRRGPAPTAPAPAPMQAPVPVTREQVTQSVTKAMDEAGAKNPDELIVMIGKPDEAAAAQARINKGTPITVDQWVDDAMRMQGGSVGAAGARPENILAGQTIFPTVEKAAEKVALGKTAPKLSREELGVPALEKMVSQTVGFLGKPLKQMREGGDFAGTLKGSQEAGEKLIAKAKKEDGSLIGYFLKQDDEGNFTNLDKTWNRADVAAFAPVVKYAERVYEALMDEAVALRKAGQLEGNALNDIAYRLQFPIQIFGVLQGKRTEASRTLNAYKLLRENWDSGKEVKGYFSPNTPCM